LKIANKIKYILLILSATGLTCSLLMLINYGKSPFPFLLGYFSLILINISIATFIYSDDEKIKKKQFRIALIIGALMAIASILFSFFHIIGANILIVETILFFVFSITPIYIYKRYQKWKQETCNTIISILLSISDFFGVFFILEGYMFKIMHWPTASTQLVIGFLFLFAAVFGWNWVYKNAITKRKTAEEKLTDAYLELEHKHKIIEEKQKEIVDSIKYAKRIQSSILPTEKYIEKHIFKRN